MKGPAQPPVAAKVLYIERRGVYDGREVINMTLGENLQHLRREAGLSQEEVAGRLFMSRQSVSKWENGQAEPGVENLKTLAQLYGVTLDELLGAPPAQQETPSEQAGPFEQTAPAEQVTPTEQNVPARDEDHFFFRTLFWVRTGLVVLENLFVSFPAGRINFPLDWIAMLVGLFVPKKWVWWLILAMEGMNVLLGLLNVMNGVEVGVLTLLYAGIITAFLFSRQVKAYFDMPENKM